MKIPYSTIKKNDSTHATLELKYEYLFFLVMLVPDFTTTTTPEPSPTNPEGKNYRKYICSIYDLV